jgi:hypothetical protein
MANEEVIDHYIDRTSIADDTKFLTGELKSVLDLLEKINSTKVTLNSAKGTSGVADAAKSAKSAADSLENAKATLLEAKAKKELASATLLEAKARKENAAASILEEKAKKAAAQSIKTEAQARKENAEALLKGQKLAEQEARQAAAQQKLLDELSNDYLQLSRAYSDAAKKAKNYALTLGESHPITIEAVKDAKAMHDILLRVDQSVGQSQRNVGNYKSAFDGLGMSFTQVARELPSLTISVQQFALAISNNLPMVADEIAKAKEEIAALKAQGKDAPSLFQRIGASLISWQIGLSVGIALLTAYAGKIATFVQGLFDGSIALRKAAEAQDILNTARKKGIQTEKEYQSLIDNDAEDFFVKRQKDALALAKARGATEKELLQLERDQLSTRLERAKINFIPDQEAFGKKFGGSEEQLRKFKEEVNKAKAAYQNFLKTGKAFGKELTKGSEDYTKADQLLKNSFDFQSLLYEEQAAKITEYYEAKRDLDVKDAEIAKFNAEQRSKFFADELQYRAEILKAFSQIEEAQEITRLNVRKQALANERAVIAGQYVDEIRDAKGNQVKIFEVDREYKFKRKKLQEDYERDVQAIRQTSIKKQREEEDRDNQMFIDDQEEQLRKAEEREQKKFDTSKNYLEQNRDILLRALEEERNAKIKSASGDKERQEIEEKYNRKRKQIELDTNVAIIQSSLAVAEAKLKTAQLTPGVDESQISALKAAIASLKKELEKLKGEKIDIDVDESIEKLEKLKNGIQEVGNKILEIFTAIGNIINANIDREKNAIQDQIDDIDKKKEKEIDAINASARTEQEKAVAIIKVKETAAAQKDALERRQRALDLQRARFEKAQAIAQAVLKTAVAVIEGLIKFGPVGAAIYGAIGAAQIATAIAAPLPKFKHGREDGPATWGITGDGGKREVVTSPDLSQAYVTPAVDTLTYLPKNWKVFPDVDAFHATAMNMVHKPLPVMPVIQNNNDGLIQAMAYEIGGLKRAIMGKQETHFHWNNGELHKSIKNGNDWWRYIQNNI